MFKLFRILAATVIICCGISSLLAAGLNGPGAAQPNLAVIGISNEEKNEDWRDARIGMGLRIILAQLFANTAEFTLVEEKGEMRTRLNNLGSAIWARNEPGYDFHSNVDTLRGFDARFIAYGKVFYFGKPRSKANLGPLHTNKNSVVIKVEIILEDTQTGKQLVGRGRGVSSTTANSAIFSYREDNVELDKTNIGNATKDALGVAVKAIMKRYEKYKRKL